MKTVKKKFEYLKKFSMKNYKDDFNNSFFSLLILSSE